MARATALLLLALLAGAAALARAAPEKEQLPAAAELEELNEEQVERAQGGTEAALVAEEEAEAAAVAPVPRDLVAPAPAPEVGPGLLAVLLGGQLGCWAAGEVAGRPPRLLEAVGRAATGERVTAALPHTRAPHQRPPAAAPPPQEATARRLLGVQESPLGRRALLGTLTVNISQGDVWKYQVGRGWRRLVGA